MDISFFVIYNVLSQETVFWREYMYWYCMIFWPPRIKLFSKLKPTNKSSFIVCKKICHKCNFKVYINSENITCSVPNCKTRAMEIGFYKRQKTKKETRRKKKRMHYAYMYRHTKIMDQVMGVYMLLQFGCFWVKESI